MNTVVDGGTGGPVLAAEFGNRLQADAAVRLLESFGVQCMVTADDCGGIAPGQSFIRGVKLYVDPDDYTRAREILRKNG